MALSPLPTPGRIQLPPEYGRKTNQHLEAYADISVLSHTLPMILLPPDSLIAHHNSVFNNRCTMPVSRIYTLGDFTNLFLAPACRPGTKNLGTSFTTAPPSPYPPHYTNDTPHYTSHPPLSAPSDTHPVTPPAQHNNTPACYPAY